jgi:hypothetical protein
MSGPAADTADAVVHTPATYHPASIYENCCVGHVALRSCNNHLLMILAAARCMTVVLLLVTQVNPTIIFF